MTQNLQSILRNIQQSAQDLKKFSQNFTREMAVGLAGGISCLAMLPAYLSLPTRQEQGVYLAVDFGGTHVRVLAFQLFGQGRTKILGQLRFSLNTSELDYRSDQVTGEELFFRIAQEVKSLSWGVKAQSIGLTFSFPFRQSSLNEAYLMQWTKEFTTAQTEGRDIATLFRQALQQVDLKLPLVAVINDTVATHLAGGYSQENTVAGVILGTGHNASYLEPCHPLTGGPMLVNIECGNFRPPATTAWDDQLDQASEKPGLQRLEKMVSGRYLEELVVRVLQDWDQAQESGLAGALGLCLPGAVMAQMMAQPLGQGEAVAAILYEHCRWTGDPAIAKGFGEIIRGLLNRSARLAAGTILGILQKDKQQQGEKVQVVIDGSLYRSMPGYAASMKDTLVEELPPQKAKALALLQMEEASALGAALAAAQGNYSIQ